MPAMAADPGVLTVAQSFDPKSLWPNWSTTQEEINASSLIVESLFWVDPKTNKTEPVLATSYEALDPKTIKINLREGVKFTNGEPFNADAVVNSINVFTDVKQTPSYSLYAVAIDRAEKQDDKTVILHMKEAYPALKLILSQIYITPPKYWAEVGGAEKFGQKPIGTGPFKMSSWTRDDKLTLASNADYWGAKPKGIKQIVFRPVPDDTARAAGLMAGEYDIVANLAISTAARVKAQPDLKIISVPSYRVFSLIMSSRPEHVSPLQDKRVRQAINYSLDKDAIIKNLFNGMANPLNGQLLRKEQLGFDPSIKDYPFDVAKAKALLAEAGYPNGFEIPFKFPAGRYVQDREVAEAVAGMLANVGIKTKMTALEAGEFLRQLINRELAPLSFSGSAPADDPDPQMKQYRSDWRYSYVADPKLDALIDAGAKEMDPQKRDVIYKEMSKIMYDDALIGFLYQSIDNYGTSSRVKNFLPRGDQRWAIYGMELAD